MSNEYINKGQVHVVYRFRNRWLFIISLDMGVAFGIRRVVTRRSTLPGSVSNCTSVIGGPFDGDIVVGEGMEVAEGDDID
jgi:hypothetical protein